MHRAACSDPVMTGAVPFVEARALPVEDRMDETEGLRLPVSPRPSERNGDVQPTRPSESRFLIHCLKVFSEQLVEQALVLRIVVLAKPPEPIRPFSGVERFPRTRVAFE